MKPKFYVWKPEDNPALFVKLRKEMWRQNKENPNLVQINWNTWVEKKKVHNEK